MATARHGGGARAAVRAYASQVHPVFMLPPIGAAWFGATLAPTLAVPPLLAVSSATFFAVYTAHVKDGYVDFHLRGEDDDHPLTRRGCRVGLAGAAVGFALSLVAVHLLAGVVAALLVLPTWFIGYLHAPTLDTRPVTATGGYPLGVAVVVVAGHYAQAGRFSPVVLAFALVFLVVLCGVKVVDDATDCAYDRSIDKRTVAVVLGPARARRLAYALMGAGLFAVVALAVDGLFPPAAALAVLPFAAVALYARAADPELATMLLVRGAYLLLAGLTVATYFRPLAGVPLPDLGVLGPYTYLATEVAFGAVALALLPGPTPSDGPRAPSPPSTRSRTSGTGTRSRWGCSPSRHARGSTSSGFPWRSTCSWSSSRRSSAASTNWRTPALDPGRTDGRRRGGATGPRDATL